MTFFEKHRVVLVQGSAIFAPIVAVCFAEYIGLNFTLAQDCALGLLAFIAIEVLNISLLVHKINDREIRHGLLAVRHEACDQQLSIIRNCFINITRGAHGQTDLFAKHFEKRIDKLTEELRDVAENKRLRVQADHFLNVDNVLDAFQGDADGIWRYVWRIDEDGKLFDNHPWKRYFEKSAAMVGQAIKEVRVVLAVGDMNLVHVPRIQKLLMFFATNPKFGCFIVKRDDYLQICTQNGVPTNYLDFGIYGSRLLFLTESYEPEIKGVFTKDERQITEYKHLFDSMWTATSIAHPNPVTGATKVTIAELYAFDDSEPVPVGATP